MEHMKHTHKDPNASGVASKYITLLGTNFGTILRIITIHSIIHAHVHLLYMNLPCEL